jgi:integron integrase
MKINQTIKFKPNPDLKLMDQVKEVLRYHHYAYRTEQTYCAWIVRYIKFHGSKKHPSLMWKKELDSFLSYLAVEEKVSASTQKQALNALVFLYRNVLDINIEGMIEPVRAKQRKHFPVVMTKNEIKKLFMHMSGTHLLMARLMYGSGLRLMECVRLRIQDIDFENKQIYVRAGKGNKDRITVLPISLKDELQIHVNRVKELHDEDLENGFGEVYLPGALGKKYPKAAKEFGWQYVFPSKKHSKDPYTNIVRRHHVMESGLQKAVKRAVTNAEIYKKATCHTLRHSFATHMLENGVNIRVLQELMGHSDVKTTEVYTHVMQKDINLIKSPLD